MLLSCRHLALVGALMLITNGAIAANTATQNNTINVNNSTDGVIAQVNDDVILKSELIDAMRDIQNNARANGQTIGKSELQKIALDELIFRKLQLSIIKRAGFSANDSIINQQMLEIAKSQGLNSLSALQSSMDSKQKGSYAALRKQIIEDAAIDALTQQQLASRIHISEADIDALLASPEGKTLNNERYHLLHIRVPFSKSNPDQKEKSEALAVAEQVRTALVAGQNAQNAMNAAQGKYPTQLQGGDMGYHDTQGLPASLAPTIIKLNKGEVSQPIASSAGFDIVKVVDKSNAVVVPQWLTSHILVKIDDTQSDALAEQKINAIYNQLQKGADFSSLAATYSDDTGSATNQGSLGWVDLGEMVPAFETVMKETHKGDYSTPFKTQFGWHILKVNDIRQADITEQYRRNMARDLLFKRMLPQAQEDWLQEMRSAAYVHITE